MERGIRCRLGLILLVPLVAAAYVVYRAGLLSRPASGPSDVISTPVSQMLLAGEDEGLRAKRLEMVERTIRARDVSDPAVLRAMESVPRHLFVPDRYRDQAYADHPLPIGYGQTISQPYIVALMTGLLGLLPGERVLEIGTGSGYQAAILAEIVSEVYSVEIIPELAESSGRLLRELGYENVRTKQGDGYYGWQEYAPFDAIIVTCAPDHVPQPLVNQLADGGRLVVPIGPPGGYQTLWQYVREEEGLKAYNIAGVTFVPLTGDRAAPGTR